MKLASDITRVSFGCTDVLIDANDAPSLELSYGRGLEGTPLHVVSKIGLSFFMTNRDHTIRTTMVGFGRTEVSSPPFLTFF